VRRRLVRLKVAGRLQERELALRGIAHACRLALDDSSSTEPLQHDLMSAVAEAFNNIAVHGYRGRRRGVVEIDVTVDGSDLAIEMRDYGHSFDPRTAPAPDLDALPEHGMGAFIMGNMVDEIDYQPGTPNVLRLVKHLE
jgi:serine/threonine-protein kinase RsbW